MTDEDGIHMHCSSCYTNHCQSFQVCPVIHCQNHCGVVFHECKLTEHLIVCRKQPRPCINSLNGCPFIVDSVSLMDHLHYCPASVVQCGITWNRTPLNSQVRKTWMPFCSSNPVPIVGDLDTEFAIADQMSLNKEMDKRIAKGSRRLRSIRSSGDVSKINKERVEHLESLIKKKHQKINRNLPTPTGNLNIHRNLTVDSMSRNTETSNSIRSGNTENSENEDTGNHECKGVKSSRISDDSLLIENERKEDRPIYTIDELLLPSSPVTFDFAVTNTNMAIAYTVLPQSNYSFNQPSISQQPYTNEENYGVIIEELKDDLDLTKLEKIKDAHSQLNRNSFSLGLNVVVERIAPYYKQYPFYYFGCYSLFRRDQYSWHVKNAHSDIAFNVNGWLMQRCPLAQYGCPYYRMRLVPKLRHIRFMKDYRCFAARYNSESSLNVCCGNFCSPCCKDDELAGTLNSTCSTYNSEDLKCNSKTKNVSTSSTPKSKSNVLPNILNSNCQVSCHCTSKSYCCHCSNFVDRFNRTQDGSNAINHHCSDVNTENSDDSEDSHRLLDLPNELLIYIFFFLDNLSLNCVAKTCQKLREISFCMMDNLGIVVTTWEKNSYEDSGTASWKEERKVRFFTSASQPIREWVHNDDAAIGKHLSECVFYHKRILTKKIRLPPS